MFTRRSLLGAAAAMAALPARAQGRPLTVFAAASLREALDAVAAAFAARGGARPVMSYAGSNQLARQIEQGAPADLFFSADEDWMEDLARRGLIREPTRRSLLGNALVLVTPAGSGLKLDIAPTLDLAARLKGGRIAMPDPVSVPAGKYAKAALEKLGLFAQVKDRIAGAENVRVALSYVARGEAPLGIVYATDARAEPKVEIAGTFPANSHPVISYPVALTTSASHPQASAFLDFLSGEEAASLFRARGFTILGEASQ